MFRGYGKPCCQGKNLNDSTGSLLEKQLTVGNVESRLRGSVRRFSADDSADTSNNLLRLQLKSYGKVC